MEINYDHNEQINSNQMEIEKGNDCQRLNSTRKLMQNLLGEEKYNINEITQRLKSLTGKEIVNEVAKLLKEKKKNVIENVFRKTEKDQFIAMVEKTLRTQNEGGSFFTRHKKLNLDGVKTTVQEKILKTPGGVFFSIVKKDCNFSKQEMKLIFDYERYFEREKEKITKELTDMII